MFYLPDGSAKNEDESLEELTAKYHRLKSLHTSESTGANVDEGNMIFKAEKKYDFIEVIQEQDIIGFSNNSNQNVPVNPVHATDSQVQNMLINTKFKLDARMHA